MRDWISNFGGFMRGAWRELPLETVAVTTSVLAAITMVHGAPLDDAGELWVLRLLLTAVVLTPLFFASTLLARSGLVTRWTQLTGGAAAALAVLGALLFAIEDEGTVERAAFLWPYGLSLLAAVLLPFVVVALGSPRDDRLARFVGFVRQFFEQTTTWGLLWGVGMIALAVVFVALDGLFDLDVERLAADTVLVVTGACILIYLYRLLPLSDRDPSTARLPEFWRRAVTAVGAPFVSVMLIILLAYEAVVLARGELPANLLSPLIIAAGFVGFLCTLIIVSILRQDLGAGPLSPADPHRWARSRSIRLVRAFPVILLVLLPMAGWALSVRIEQYGFTPFRVARMMALLCLAGLSALGTLRWLRHRMVVTWEVPACMIAFSLVTAFGPISATSLATRSQADRLERMLTAAGVAGREVAAVPTDARYPVTTQQYWELCDQIESIASTGGEAGLRRVFTGDVAVCAARWNSDQCLARLGVESPSNGKYNLDHTYHHGTFGGAFSGAGLRVELIELAEERDHVTAMGRLTLEGGAVVWYDAQGQRLGHASLSAAIAATRASGSLPSALVDLRDASGRSLGQLAVNHLAFYDVGADLVRITQVSGVLVRRTAP